MDGKQNVLRIPYQTNKCYRFQTLRKKMDMLYPFPKVPDLEWFSEDELWEYWDELKNKK